MWGASKHAGRPPLHRFSSTVGIVLAALRSGFALRPFDLCIEGSIKGDVSGGPLNRAGEEGLLQDESGEEMDHY
jgi:hypothetical protein